MGRGVTVTTDNGHPGLSGRSRSNDMHNALTHIIDVKQCDTKLFAVFTQRFNLLLLIESAMGRLRSEVGTL